MDIKSPSKRSYSSFRLTRTFLTGISQVIDEEDVKDETDEEEMKVQYKIREKLDPCV